MPLLAFLLLLMAVLIAAYFYLERAKQRDAGKTLATKTTTTTEPASAPVDRVD